MKTLEKTFRVILEVNDGTGWKKYYKYTYPVNPDKMGKIRANMENILDSGLSVRVILYPASTIIEQKISPNQRWAESEKEECKKCLGSGVIPCGDITISCPKCEGMGIIQSVPK